MEKVFKRKLYDKMLAWKQERRGDSALLIKGARRVGKSTLVEEFAKNEYDSYVLIDFAQNSSEIDELFENIRDLNYFFLRLQGLFNVVLYERRSCIIFDEVQLKPIARQAIKYLVKDGRYDNLLKHFGSYYIGHFKQLFVLGRSKDGFPGFGNVSMEDIERRNSIAYCLQKWNMIEVINPEDIDMKTILDLSQISTFTKNIALYVRLTRKNIPKSFYNKISQKEGKLLTFDLIDKNGSQMQAVIFDDVIEKFSPILKEGNIYYIKGGHAKFNDKRFTTIKTDYKLYFDFNTQIMEVDKNLDNLFNKEEEKLNITKFVDLINCEQTKLVNCISYVLQSFPGLAKSSNKGKNYLIRKLVLCDSSMFKDKIRYKRRGYTFITKY